jgi:acyl carrier protein
MTDITIAKRVEMEVRQALCEALELDDDEITPEATIMDDLGAESIDLLDLRFRLEKALGLKITNEDLATAFTGVETEREFRQAFTVEAMNRYLVTRLGAEGG